MPHYRPSELESIPGTPVRCPSWGKEIIGETMVFQLTTHDKDRGDGTSGARPHSHPEEQLFIIVSGKMRIREEDTWYELLPGDVFFVRPNVEHEESCTETCVFYSIKNRISGHNWHTTKWADGAKEAYEKVDALLEENKKYRFYDYT